MISMEDLKAVGYQNKRLVRHDVNWNPTGLRRQFIKNADMQSGKYFSPVINGSPHL